MDFAQPEDSDGIRLTWNIWPNSRLEATKCVIPFAALYTPIKRLPNMPVRAMRSMACDRSRCAATWGPGEPGHGGAYQQARARSEGFPLVCVCDDTLMAPIGLWREGGGWGAPRAGGCATHGATFAASPCGHAGAAIRARALQAVRRHPEPVFQRGLPGQAVGVPVLLLAQPLPSALPGGVCIGRRPARCRSIPTGCCWHARSSNHAGCTRSEGASARCVHASTGCRRPPSAQLTPRL